MPSDKFTIKQYVMKLEKRLDQRFDKFEERFEEFMKSFGEFTKCLPDKYARKEEVKELKKVAWSALVGLVAGLFGIIAYLIDKYIL